MDPYKHLKISLNPDGSLTRYADIPIVPPTGDDSAAAAAAAAPVLSKDVPLNKTHNTWLRIFLSNNTSPSKKLPVILYIHGGGFVLCSAASAFFHSLCDGRAAKIPAIILSVDYRLAPEHRLPAAYEDAVDALIWARDQARCIETADPWLTDYADFNKFFIMGTSAGANIAYHLALRSPDLDLRPLQVSGLILNQPFFGGEERTESEARSADNMIIPLAVNDLFWELALPIGANRDHEYCNPKNTKATKRNELPRCLVKGFIGDPLYDRQREFVRMMEEEKQGASVVAYMEDQGFHGIEVVDPSKAEALIDDCRRFIYGGSGGGSDGGAGGN